MNLDEARGRVAEMIEVRCSCGFAEKIEAAVERIRKAEGFTSLSLGANGDLWVNISGKGSQSVPKVCNLPAAILELADKVKPPKPKEREWRVGDVVELVEPLAYEQFKVGMKAILGDLAIRPPESWPTNIKHPDSVSLSLHAGPKNWRNLTIEGEMAGEKSETPECGFGYTNP